MNFDGDEVDDQDISASSGPALSTEQMAMLLAGTAVLVDGEFVEVNE